MDTSREHMKFIFFGTPYVARDTLAILLERGYKPELVITSPDSPRGRGLVLTPSETKTLAIENGIPVLTPEKITSEVIEEIKKYDAQYALVAAYGKILPTELIDSFPLGILNVHYSLLPKYRGASPAEAALLHGDTETGVTIQQMVPELDAGDILASVTVPIEPTETTRELRPRLVTIGANVLADLLPDFENGNVTPSSQDHAQATKCRKIKKEDGMLELSTNPETARENWQKYRAYAESPGTYFFQKKKDEHTGEEKLLRMKVTKASFNDGVFTVERVIPEGKKERDFVE
jgi:methionyl-tRNA formyltransferase